MERLTELIYGYPHGKAFIPGSKKLSEGYYRGRFDATAIVERLYAYEETRLEPQEIIALKAEVEKYKMFYEGYREQHETCFDKLADEYDAKIAVLERALYKALKQYTCTESLGECEGCNYEDLSNREECIQRQIKRFKKQAEKEMEVER